MALGSLGEPFSKALSLLWRGYAEARRRDFSRRFVATAAIADVGAERLSLRGGRSRFADAVLLHTTNASRPAASSFGVAWRAATGMDGGKGDASEGDTAETAVATAALGPSGPPLSADAAEEALVSSALARASSGRLLLGFATSDMFDFALNWAASLTDLGMTGWLLVALDASVYVQLQRATNVVAREACAFEPPVGQVVVGRATNRRSSSILASAASPEGLSLTAQRLRAIQLLLSRTQLAVLACDVDAVALRNPWPSIDQLLAGRLDPLQRAEEQRPAEAHAIGDARLSRPYELLLLSEWPDGRSLCGGGGMRVNSSIDLSLWPCASLGIGYFGPTALRFVDDLHKRIVEAAAQQLGGKFGAPSVLAILAAALGLPQPPTAAATVAAPMAARAPSADTSVRWRLLEPALFPNGFLAFRRPLSLLWRARRNDSDAPAAVVMLRASWPHLRGGDAPCDNVETLRRYTTHTVPAMALPVPSELSSCWDVGSASVVATARAEAAPTARCCNCAGTSSKNDGSGTILGQAMRRAAGSAMRQTARWTAHFTASEERSARRCCSRAPCGGRSSCRGSGPASATPAPPPSPASMTMPLLPPPFPTTARCLSSRRYPTLCCS